MPRKYTICSTMLWIAFFKDAKVQYSRINSRGQTYSIAEDAYQEFVHWFDMPWE